MNVPTTHKHASLCPAARRPRCALRRRASGEDGQALVEFALVLPVLVVLVFGITLFGLALNDWIDETQLAGQAARFASVNSEHGTKEAFNETKFLKWVSEQGDNAQVKSATAEICSPTSAVGDYLKVRLSYLYSWLNLSSMLGVGSPSTRLTSTATMRIEIPPKTAYKKEFPATKEC
jgi:Flp pilus assembly protein TadG